jgi:hypothetical protein
VELEELRARLKVTRQIKFHTPEHKSGMLLDHSGQLRLVELNTDGAMTFKMNHRKRGWGDLNSVGRFGEHRRTLSIQTGKWLLSQLNDYQVVTKDSVKCGHLHQSVRSYCLGHVILLWAIYYSLCENFI